MNEKPTRFTLTHTRAHTYIYTTVTGIKEMDEELWPMREVDVNPWLQEEGKEKRKQKKGGESEEATTATVRAHAQKLISRLPTFGTGYK